MVKACIAWPFRTGEAAGAVAVAAASQGPNTNLMTRGPGAAVHGTFWSRGERRISSSAPQRSCNARRMCKTPARRALTQLHVWSCTIAYWRSPNPFEIPPRSRIC